MWINTGLYHSYQDRAQKNILIFYLDQASLSATHYLCDLHEQNRF